MRAPYFGVVVIFFVLFSESIAQCKIDSKIIPCVNVMIDCKQIDLDIKSETHCFFNNGTSCSSGSKSCFCVEGSISDKCKVCANGFCGSYLTYPDYYLPSSDNITSMFLVRDSNLTLHPYIKYSHQTSVLVARHEPDFSNNTNLIDSCSLRQNGDVVNVWTSKKDSCVVTTSLNGWSSSDVVDVSLSVVLPDAVKYTSGNVRVVGRCLSGRIYCEMRYKAEYRCNVDDCIFCSSTLTTLYCMPQYIQLSFIVAVLTIIFLGLAILRPIFRMLFLVCKSCFSFFYVKNRPRSNSDRLNRIEMMLMAKSFETRTKDEVTPTPCVSTKKGKTSKQLYLLGLLCLSVPGFCCDEVIVLSANMSSCTRINDDAVDCSLDTVSEFTLPTISSTVCFDIAGSNTSVTRLEIHWVESYVRTIREALYNAYDFETNSGAVRYCAGEYACVDKGGKPPGALLNPMDINPDGVFGNSPSGLFFGRSGFGRGYGCAGNGCLSCDGSCVWHRWFLRPKGRPFKVEKILSSYVATVLQLTLKTGDNIVTSQKEVTSYSSFSFLDLADINFQGQYAGVSLQGASNFVVNKNDGRGYICDTSMVNGPIVGTVGEFQCDDEKCKGDEDLVTVNEIGDTMSFNFKTSAVSRIKDICLELPSSYGAYYMLNNDEDLMIWPNSVGALRMGLTWKRNVQVSLAVDLVCPLVEFISIDGCYSCSAGWSIELVLYSPCGLGIVSFAGDNINLVTSNIAINLVPTKYYLRGYSNVANLNGTIFYSNRSGIVGNISVSYVLTKVSFLGNESSITNATVLVGGGRVFPRFSFDFGFSNFTNGLISTLIIVTTVIILALCGYFLYLHFVRKQKVKAI